MTGEVRRIDHVNIRTTRMEESALFYQQLLGLTRSSPPGITGVKAIWMLDGEGYPIVHLNAPPADEPLRAENADTGRLHHVAFDCIGHDIIKARLDAMGADYECNLVESIDLRQIFVFDPNGLRLELNFTGD
ncbi:VOC family protein (plasmid) [Sphingobium sp. SJ10-10]|uniref:VOC family protein n=1 Tax=Sphingobium sp. SJ10-10 TaxID=3114999 RepID=UPI002E190C95|nr:VOC family protein [Sphingobium sp. SJ10-10]